MQGAATTASRTATIAGPVPERPPAAVAACPPQGTKASYNTQDLTPRHSALTALLVPGIPLRSSFRKTI